MVERNKTFQIMANAVMIILVVFCMLPLLLLFSSSLNEEHALIVNGYSFLPSKLDFSAYKYILVDSTQLLRGYGISALVTLVGTTVNLVFTTLFAYPLSRKDLPGKNMIAFFLFFTMLFNGGMVTFYMVVKGIGLYNTRWAVILPACVSAFNLILVRTTMTSIPKSLEESAMLDGAGPVRILFQIYLPLMKATLATVTLYYAIFHWNSWFNASLFLQDREKFPLQLVLQEILVINDNVKTVTSAGDLAGNTDLYKQLIKYCTIMVATVPVLCFYPFIMKYFKTGVMIGSIKG